MAIRSLIQTCLCGLLLAAAPDVVSSREIQTQQPPNLDTVLAAYVGGDVEIVSRSYVRSLDFQLGLRLTRPRFFDRWLGAWDRHKAVLVLELANAAVRTGPQWTSAITGAGRRYLASARLDPRASEEVAAIEAIWHRTAVGLLMRFGDPARVEEHAAAAISQSQGLGGSVDARLVLARAIAQEVRCWDHRPALDHPGPEVEQLTRVTGARVDADLDGPRASDRRKRFELHRACLREAATRFEAAAALDETRAEALARRGWVLFQDGRLQEAADALRAVTPGDDRVLAYWTGLFRGRAYGALGRTQEAADAYRAALALFPGAQAAGTGLALELARLDLSAEADKTALTLRAAGPSAADPWSDYQIADQRFVDGWIRQLRTARR